MKPHNIFDVHVSYLLTEHMSMQLQATAELRHSEPHYLITNIVHEGAEDQLPVIPDISIKAIRGENNAVCWVHTDSNKASVLSTLIGKAIEKRGMIEMAL